MPRTTRDGKWKMHPGYGILAAIVMAVGIFFAVQGFVLQLTLQGGWDMNTMWWILGYYFVGVLLIGGAKMLKWKAYGHMNK